MAAGCQAAGFEKYLLTYRFGALLQALKKAALLEPPFFAQQILFETSIYLLASL